MIEIAALAAFAISFKIGRAILPYMRSSFVPNFSKYVIVNGCTDGIGKQYAIHLAQLGIPLILVSRSQAKLDNLRKQLVDFNRSQINHKLLKVDYADQKLNDVNYIQLLYDIGIKQQSIGGIINCCGQAWVEKYSQNSYQVIERLKRVNTCSLQIALKVMTSKLISASPFIINLSSHTAHFPLKYSSVYSASKAYSSNLFIAFSRQNSNIKTLLVEPWYVTTKMTGFRKTWDCVTPQQIVLGSFKAINARQKCAGTIKHQIIYQFKYLIQKYYSFVVLEQNYQRVTKLKQLKKRRVKNKQNQLINKEQNRQQKQNNKNS